MRPLFLVWSCAGSTDLNHLKKPQNRAARLTTNGSFDPPSTLLNHGETKTMVFKSLNGLDPQYVNELPKNLQVATDNHRNTAIDLQLPIKKTLDGQKALSHRGAKLWNSLTAESKQTPTLSYFKKVVN